MRTKTTLVVATWALASLVANADVFDMGPGRTSLEVVTVGNPGNVGESSGTDAPGTAPALIVGGVSYLYQIGTFEVTAGQYTEFLNAVAATDEYGLYDTRMDYDANPGTYGCNIKRTSELGSFSYSVAADWANRPVNWVSWDDAARFTNWLHNGQPRGSQDISTTEDGSYFLNGATTYDALKSIARRPSATWIIPTEDEWYKAAYYGNDGAATEYWLYPTGSNQRPDATFAGPDLGNSATYGVGYVSNLPYQRTEVGAHSGSASPYGTFDQGGNVCEWTETIVLDAYGNERAIRGGNWYDSSDALTSSIRNYTYLTNVHAGLGFRVARVPEPNSIALLIAAALMLLLYSTKKCVIRRP